jgi:hypothetical protein
MRQLGEHFVDPPSSMSRLLNRNEGLTEGVQRISKELKRNLLQAIGKKLRPAQVHDARKIIKNLRAILRLTRGAMRRAEHATKLCEILPPRCRGRAMRR